MVQRVPFSAIFSSHPSLLHTLHSRSPADDHNGHVTAPPHTTKADMDDANAVMHKKTLINVNKLPFMTVRPPAIHCGGCERCVNPHQLQPNRFNTLAVIFTACKVPPIVNAQKRRQNKTKLAATSPLAAARRNYCIRRTADRWRTGFNFGYRSSVLSHQLRAL